MVWLAYFLIPVIILKYVLKKRSGIHFQKVYLLFAAFILLCGSTHFLDAVMFWHPMYRFNALVRFITGIVSMVTVLHLIRILPGLVSQKTNIELGKEIFLRESAEKKLAEANKNLEAFAFVASHDLQEPLRKIGMYTDMLGRSNKSSRDFESSDVVNKIIHATNRMRTMIDDVLSLSTIPDEISMKNINTSAVLQKAIDDLEVKIIEKDAIINISELPDVKGNEAYLAHVFMNLLGNALKFSRNRPVINITGHQSGGKAFINIEDKGIGMNKEDLDKIFTAFHRLNSKTQFEGSGLGLSISKRIVDLHGGNITVKSEMNKGTTFCVELQSAEG